jgi:acetoacetyl-CoA reductase
VTACVALVTGGIGGIGSAICRQLASNGHQVIAVDLPASEASLSAFSERMGELPVHFEAGDVRSFDDCAVLVRRVEVAHGPISVLINNAGIARDASLRKMEPAQWDEVLSVNLDSVFNLSKQVVDGMCDRGFGRIVNISSIIGQTGAFGQSNYAAAKAGMHGFTMALAREVARKGVTVNSISPGYIRSAMTDAIPEEIRAQVLASVPVGRIGLPEDIARAVAFLCTEESSYITGVNLPVNGGLFMSF